MVTITWCSVLIAVVDLYRKSLPFFPFDLWVCRLGKPPKQTKNEAPSASEGTGGVVGKGHLVVLPFRDREALGEGEGLDITLGRVAGEGRARGVW